MSVKVGDLKDQTGTHDRSILYCVCCGGEYSANAGDYFMLPKSEVLTCCEEPLKRVVKSTTFKEV